MREIVWSDTAIDQFENAIAYMAERNPSAALRLSDRVLATIESLAVRPIGRPGERADTFEKGVFKTSYLLVYGLVGGPDGELKVHRLFHMAQNWRGWTPEAGEEI